MGAESWFSTKLTLVVGLVIVGLLSMTTVSAKTYPITWDTHPSFGLLEQASTLEVGDTLNFQYNSLEHNVLQVTAAAFSKCDGHAPIQRWTDGNSTITLSNPGKFFFICGMHSHCKDKQFLIVVVEEMAPTVELPPTQPPNVVQTTASAPAPSISTEAKFDNTLAPLSDNATAPSPDSPMAPSSDNVTGPSSDSALVPSSDTATAPLDSSVASSPDARGPSNGTAATSDSITAPSDSAMTPSDNSIAPSDNSTSPSLEGTGPTAGTMRLHKTIPVDSSFAPSKEATAPSAGAMTPSEEPTAQISVSAPTPSVETQAPLSDGMKPSGEEVVPSKEAKAPLAEVVMLSEQVTELLRELANASSVQTTAAPPEARLSSEGVKLSREGAIALSPEATAPLAEAMTPSQEAETPSAEAMTPSELAEARTPSQEAEIPSAEAMTPSHTIESKVANSPEADAMTAAMSASAPSSESGVPLEVVMSPVAVIVTSMPTGAETPSSSAKTLPVGATGPLAMTPLIGEAAQIPEVGGHLLPTKLPTHRVWHNEPLNVAESTLSMSPAPSNIAPSHSGPQPTKSQHVAKAPTPSSSGNVRQATMQLTWWVLPLVWVLWI
ncbi:unnamed protein product [Calypogeia fissa]